MRKLIIFKIFFHKKFDAMFTVSYISRVSQENEMCLKYTDCTTSAKNFCPKKFCAKCVLCAKRTLPERNFEIFEIFFSCFPVFLTIFIANFSIFCSNFAILHAKMVDNRKINCKYEQICSNLEFKIRFYTGNKKFCT